MWSNFIFETHKIISEANMLSSLSQKNMLELGFNEEL